MEHLDVIGLIRAGQNLERSASVLLMYSGLRVPQFRLMEQVNAAGRATVTEISAHLGITRASASVLVNELLQERIVETRENPEDRRSFYIQLTVSGRDKLQVARRDLGVMVEELSRKYPVEMIRMLNVFVGKMGMK